MRKKLRRNPALENEYGYDSIPTNPQRKEIRPPFLRSMETSDDFRKYVFSPTIETEFAIIVNFPITDYGEVKTSIVATNINPRELQAAIDFVVRNENEFAEAFVESVPKDKAKPHDFNISEKAYKAFAP